MWFALPLLWCCSRSSGNNVDSNTCGRSERSGEERTECGTSAVLPCPRTCAQLVCAPPWKASVRSMRGCCRWECCDRAGPRHRCMACRLCWARLSPRAHADAGSCMLKADGHQPSMETRVQATRDGHYKRRNDPAGNAVRPKPYTRNVAITGVRRIGSQFVVRRGHYELL